MVTPPEAAEQQEKEALRSWSSSKYAESELFNFVQPVRLRRFPRCEESRDYRKPYWVTADPYGITYARDGENIIWADHRAKVVSEAEKETGEVVREIGKWMNAADTGTTATDQWHDPKDVDYDPETGRTLVADSHARVAELTPNFEFKRQISNTADHHFGNPRGAAYFPKKPERFFVVDRANHWAVLTDWDGNEYWTFGEHGVAGSDLSHLDTPCRPAACWVNSSDSFQVWIADTGNDRFLRVDDAGNVLRQIPCNNARGVDVQINFTGFANQGFPWAGVLGGKRPIGMVPKKSNDISIHPSTPFKIITTSEFTIYEWDLRNVHVLREKPSMGRALMKYWEGHSIDANASDGLRGFWPWGYGEAEVIAESTQNATLDIEIGYNTQIFFADWDGSWTAVDTIDLSAGTRVKKTFRPDNFFGFTVNMGGTAGDVDLWVKMGE